MKKRVYVSYTHQQSLDDLFRTADVRATEPIPPRTDEHEVVFRSSNGPIECGGDGREVRLRVTGGLVRVGPRVEDAERLSIGELMRVGRDLCAPEAYRPPWLDVLTVPRLRARPFLTPTPGGGMRTMSLELCLSGYPWSAIGKVFINRASGDRKMGSGVLVGPNLLLTASHAMPWGTSDSTIQFLPNYLLGANPSFGDAWVERWWGVANSDSVTGLDYVICKLNWRIGDRTGWLGSEWHSDEDWYYDNPWISVGYPAASPSGGEAASLEMPVSVEDIDNDSDGLEIETDNFNSGGWSGGPLWGWSDGQPRVIGICSGLEKDFLDPTRGVFAGGEHLVNLVKYGWANWT
jgi:V8-like Glu-specific endopeptidase